MAALLHDVTDAGTGVTIGEVADHAGGDVAALVHAVAKLSCTNQLCRRRHRQLQEAGEAAAAAAEVEAMKSMILQTTDEPLVRTLPGHTAAAGSC
jgi:(p)ppGpp synthase/HD superfamily hydrolase